MSKDKYDRQTRLWGEGQILICAAKLLCLNSDSCTCEILKNLILSGVGEVTIVDDAKITQEDLKNNFFVDADDVNKSRGEIVLKNLLELNPDVKGNFINKSAKEYMDDEKNEDGDDQGDEIGQVEMDLMNNKEVLEQRGKQLREIHGITEKDYVDKNIKKLLKKGDKEIDILKKILTKLKYLK